MEYRNAVWQHVEWKGIFPRSSGSFILACNQSMVIIISACNQNMEIIILVCNQNIVIYLVCVIRLL